MSPDWADPTFAMARQFPASPCVVITAGTPCQLRVGGRLVTAMPIDADNYPAGTQVKPLQLGPEWLFLPMSSKYPASYLEPLASWATKSQEALFMKYVLEQSNCQKLKVYSRGRVLAVLSEYLLSVACWDGVTRSLPVDYMGKGTTGDFKAGDRCLVYDNIAQKIVIGFAGDEPRESEGGFFPGPIPDVTHVMIRWSDWEYWPWYSINSNYFSVPELNFAYWSSYWEESEYGTATKGIVKYFNQQGNTVGDVPYILNFTATVGDISINISVPPLHGGSQSPLDDTRGYYLFEWGAEVHVPRLIFVSDLSWSQA